MSKYKVPKEVSEYFAELGKLGGATNKRKGSEYFKYVRSFGKQKKQKEVSEHGGSGETANQTAENDQG